MFVQWQAACVYLPFVPLFLYLPALLGHDETCINLVLCLRCFLTHHSQNSNSLCCNAFSIIYPQSDLNTFLFICRSAACGIAPNHFHPANPTLHTLTRQSIYQVGIPTLATPMPPGSNVHVALPEGVARDGAGLAGQLRRQIGCVLNSREICKEILLCGWTWKPMFPEL